MQKCPHCGISRSSLSTPCNVCGFDAKQKAAPSQDKAKSTRYKYPNMWIGIYLTTAGFLFLSIGFAFIDVTDPYDMPLPMLIVALALLLPSIIYWLMCVYDLHCILERHTKGKYPISPSKAVWYGFIPFFNFYWMFRWTNQIAEFVNQRNPPKKMRKGWHGFWLLCSYFVSKKPSNLSYLIRFIVGVRLVNRVRQVIEQTEETGRTIPIIGDPKLLSEKPIRGHCIMCKSNFPLSTSDLGDQIVCPVCSEDASITTICTHCNQHIDTNGRTLGSLIPCPTCHREFICNTLETTNGGSLVVCTTGRVEMHDIASTLSLMKQQIREHRQNTP